LILFAWRDLLGDRTTTFAGDVVPAKSKALLMPYRSERAVLGDI
jgi:hypothetical protein